MNYIYCINIKTLNWSQLKPHMSIIDRFLQYDIEQFKFEEDKCRSLLGKMLVQYILKKHENYLSLVLPSFNYNNYKKPWLNVMKGYFNISHSYDWVVCAYNEQSEIGVDIEKKTPIDINEYASIMTANEYRYLLNNHHVDFFQLWTLKESIIKAEGKGFFLSANSFELSLPFKHNDSVTIGNQRWYLYSKNFRQDYHVSLASKFPINSTLGCIELSLETLLNIS